MVIAFRCRVTLTANTTGVPSLSDRNQEAAASVELPNERPPYLHEDVLTRVRDVIVECHIAAGARISEREICDALGNSLTPLREALKVLAAEGIVELLPNRGARVRRFGEECMPIIWAANCPNIINSIGKYTAPSATSRATRFCFPSRSLVAVFSRCLTPPIWFEGSRWSDAMSEHELMLDALHRRAGRDLGEILYEHIMGKCEAACTFLEHADEAQAAPPRASSL